MKRLMSDNFIQVQNSSKHAHRKLRTFLRCLTHILNLNFFWNMKITEVPPEIILYTEYDALHIVFDRCKYKNNFFGCIHDNLNTYSKCTDRSVQILFIVRCALTRLEIIIYKPWPRWSIKDSERSVYIITINLWLHFL